MPKLKSDRIDLLLAMASALAVAVHFFIDGAYKYPLAFYFGLTLIVSMVLYRGFHRKDT
jgi:hypothetical protein